MNEAVRIKIVKLPFPEGVHGICEVDGNGYIVGINSNDPLEKQKSAFIHEMLHIWHKDIEKEDVQKIETIRHAETRCILLEAGREYTAGAGHYTITSIDGDTIRFTVRDVGGTFVMKAEPFKKMIKGEV